jgi:2-polyprenyl-6-methoxyphenol hydroxylase-like FAD-dependent oxidoreductase
MRLLQTLGLAERVAGEMIPLREYQWYGADREPLMTLTPQQPAISGWEPSYLFFQPEFERALDGYACARHGVSLHRGWIGEGLVNVDNAATVTLRRDDERRPASPAATSASRSAGWWSTWSRTTWPL